MRALTIVVLLAGFALFGWLLLQADLGTVAHLMTQLGWLGAITVLVAFAIGFQADVFSWHLTFRNVGLSARWTLRLWLVNMVGEALNIVAPFGSVGGEPFKALLLKRHYRVSYPDGVASLLLIQTVNSLAEVPFVIVGLILMLARGVLSPAFETTLTIACFLLVGFMAFVLVALHLRWLSYLPRRLKQTRWGRGVGTGIEVLMSIEEQIVVFVRQRPLRFAVAVLFAFGNWLCGAVELFLVLHFLGSPLGFADCWLIEATVVLVRSATFFLPAHIGAQDGTIAFLCGVLTGSAPVGLAVALVRRARELLWSLLGLMIGGWFSLRAPAVAAG